jgi:hypothetical protein
VDRISAISTKGIEQALDRIDEHGFKPLGRNTDYAAVARGRPYPPLAVAAFAIEADEGGVLPPGSPSGDRKGQFFQLLENAGCTILTIRQRSESPVAPLSRS